jgi:hypothetical protein
MFMNTHATWSYARTDYDETITFEGDQMESDFSGHMSLTYPGVTVDFDAILVGGDLYVRPTGGEWTRAETGSAGEPFDPFALATNDVTFVDSRLEGGRWLYHLRITPDGSKVTQFLRKQEVSAEPIDLYVDEFGQPVALTLDYSITGKLAGERFDGSYSFEFEFSPVGDWVWISPPI